MSESIDLKKETLNPIKFITEAGCKLHLSEEAISTAAVYYHTFCSVMTIQNYDTPLLLMAALNLAAKAQEQSTKLGDLVNTCHRCLHKHDPPLEVGDLYWQLKDSVAKYELLLLRALQFNLNIPLPHTFLLHYLLALSRWFDESVWTQSHMTKISWALLQDSFYLDLCLRFPPNTIATGVLYLGLHCCGLEVPGSTDAHTKPWWTVFSPGTNEKELRLIADKLMNFYDDIDITQML